jgi:hypothetical protein
VDRFYGSNDRQVSDVEEQFYPSQAHVASAHAEDLQGWLLTMQGTGEIAAMQVPRGFSRHDQ